jgi:hypothetical protein
MAAPQQVSSAVCLETTSGAQVSETQDRGRRTETLASGEKADAEPLAEGTRSAQSLALQRMPEAAAREEKEEEEKEEEEPKVQARSRPGCS